MSGKGSISRMSDECLIKQETVVSFYTQYQAVMRKFTLADITKFKEKPSSVKCKGAHKSVRDSVGVRTHDPMRVTTIGQVFFIFLSLFLSLCYL